MLLILVHPQPLLPLYLEILPHHHLLLRLLKALELTPLWLPTAKCPHLYSHVLLQQAVPLSASYLIPPRYLSRARPFISNHNQLRIRFPQKAEIPLILFLLKGLFEVDLSLMMALEAVLEVDKEVVEAEDWDQDQDQLEISLLLYL